MVPNNLEKADLLADWDTRAPQSPAEPSRGRNSVAILNLTGGANPMQLLSAREFEI